MVPSCRPLAFNLIYVSAFFINSFPGISARRLIAQQARGLFGYGIGLVLALGQRLHDTDRTELVFWHGVAALGVEDGWADDGCEVW